MTNEDPNAAVGNGTARRQPRQGLGGSPVGSTLSIVLAVVAVVAGFLILRNITDDGGGSSGGAPSDSTTPTSTTDPPPTSTTEPPLVTAGTQVVVANASGVAQSAAGMTAQLATVGFEMGEATNATSSGVLASVVHYDPAIPAAEAVANSVAKVMGGLAVSPLPTPIPVEGNDLKGAGVLVMLGRNEAGKTIDQLSPSDDASRITAPEVSGDPANSTESTTAP